MPGAAELRAHTYDLLRLLPGQSVADVGCGTGRAVAELADRGARPIGVDIDAQMLAVARRRWPSRDFATGGAEQLPIPAGSVAGYRADKVLHLVDDPIRALAEAQRVLASRGRIVLTGQDWDGIMIDSVDPGLTRTIVHARADTIAHPRAARQSHVWLLDAGFRDVTTDVLTAVLTDTRMLPLVTGLADAACDAGAVTRDRADVWTAEHTRRAQTGRLFVAVPIFVTAATRP
ncbi:Methyltransferase domain-containing protein [Geodermatophilus aquaeductus]|uniref:Methyltransferase domain-containing protein n=2 Tax=Geodermatophilus aquaeductus TaxID=1564161 RepID=A0A521F663_9ACTN|nr:Methyltransferase domain-containing protein [Geodermatophilus aquaeductus]